MTHSPISNENEEKEENNDTGYYTPKNILNPAMFRLAEITRALSEVNMEVEQEKYIDEQQQKRHTIINTLEVFNSEEQEDQIKPSDIEPLHSKRSESKLNEIRRTSWLEENKDDIGKILLFSLSLSIGLFLVVLCLSWPE